MKSLCWNLSARTYVLLAMFAVAAWSSGAPFDQALVCDHLGHKVDRYNAETGEYLGSFGQDLLTGPSQVVVSQTMGLAFVSDTTLHRIEAFDLGTGTSVGGCSTSEWVGNVSAISTLNNGELVTSDTWTRRVNPFTGVASQFFGASMVMGHFQASTGVIWFMSSYGHTLSSGALGNYFITQRYTIPGSQRLFDISGLGNQMVLLGHDDNSNTQSIYLLTTAGTAVVSLRTVSFASGGSMWTAGSGIGASGDVYSLQYDAGHTLTRWNPNTNSLGSLTLNNTQRAYGMAIVPAPEPASALILFVGLVPLVRKSRKSNRP